MPSEPIPGATGIYTSPEAVDAYIEGGSPYTDPAELLREIERAERDLDHHCFGPRGLEFNGRKFDPATLEPDEVEALSRATCAQVQYRYVMGPDHFVQAQRQEVVGRSFTARGKLPIIGPQTWRELTHTGLLALVTSTGDRRRMSDRDVGWHER